MTTHKNAAPAAVMAEPCLNAAEAFNDAESKVCEAFAVARTAIADNGTDAARGVFHLIDWLDDRFEVAGVGGAPDAAVFAELCSSIESVIAVIHLVTQRVECILLTAAETILMAALDTLDEAVNAMNTPGMRGAA